MKKCPQCSTVYTDDVAFCLNDGTPLVEESFSMPSADSDEPETIIRHDPIVIDVSDASEHHQLANQPVIPAENIVVVPADTAAVNKNYALFLVIGLIIGGGLVLATLWFSKNFYQNANAVKTNTNDNQPFRATEVLTPTPTPTNKIVEIEPASNKHSEPNENFAGIANGRVIVTNARVRAAPDKDAPIVDTLPYNDRLDIIRRENENSPWYQVECEHGTNGWMHGDTIEFTR